MRYLCRNILYSLDYVRDVGLLSSIQMKKQMHKLLLVIVALALALSPLRGALALPVSAAADDMVHCAQMKNGMHSPDHMADMQDSTADNSVHECDQGCDGDCCDGACNTCAHGAIALSSPITVSSQNPNNSLTTVLSYGVSGRTVHPPFRPPISLQS